MKISGELRFIPNKCKWQYEDNCLENNWGVSLEREEISFEYKKKL